MGKDPRAVSELADVILNVVPLPVRVFLNSSLLFLPRFEANDLTLPPLTCIPYLRLYNSFMEGVRKFSPS